MKTILRKVGNSQGIIIPKPLLAQIGLEDEAGMTTENGALVTAPGAPLAREGWASAGQAIANERDDAPARPESDNVDDAPLKW